MQDTEMKTNYSFEFVPSFKVDTSGPVRILFNSAAQSVDVLRLPSGGSGRCGGGGTRTEDQPVRCCWCDKMNIH